MAASLDRRAFLKTAAAAGVGVGVAGSFATWTGQAAPNEKVVVAIMGTNSRGAQLARGFARLAEAEVAYVADVDAQALATGIKSALEGQDRTPRGIEDFRRALEDPVVDALVIAAPDHWHAPAALLAAQAGKHVYVEKPCGHNPREGELLVEAARRYNRVIQMGNQRRTWPRVVEAVQALRGGIIGRPYYARAWFASARGPIGYGRPGAVPAGLNYELWQGPAPRRPFRDNLVHYNWHWFWHWGTGELGNNGTHEVDVARWGLGVDYPTRVVSAGGRYHYQDDWETPDTQVVAFDFEDGRTIAWEGRSCNSRPIEGTGRGVTFHGEQGTMLIEGNGYVVYDADNREIQRADKTTGSSEHDVRGPGADLDAGHLQNFVDAIRKGARLNSEIEEGHKSVLLTHLGNIAQRTGRTLHVDPRNGRIVGDPQAMQLWGRDYEPGWEPVV